MRTGYTVAIVRSHAMEIAGGIIKTIDASGMVVTVGHSARLSVGETVTTNTLENDELDPVFVMLIKGENAPTATKRLIEAHDWQDKVIYADPGDNVEEIVQSHFRDAYDH